MGVAQRVFWLGLVALVLMVICSATTAYAQSVEVKLIAPYMAFKGGSFPVVLVVTLDGKLVPCSGEGSYNDSLKHEGPCKPLYAVCGGFVKYYWFSGEDEGVCYIEVDVEVGEGGGVDSANVVVVESPATLASRVAKLEESVGASVSRLSSLAEEVRSLVELYKREIGEVKGKLEELAGRVDTLSERVNELAKSVEENLRRVAMMDTDLKSVKSDLEKLRERVGSLESTVIAHGNRIARAEESLRGLKSSVDRLTMLTARELADVKGRLTSLPILVDRLSGLLARLETDIMKANQTLARMVKAYSMHSMLVKEVCTLTPAFIVLMLVGTLAAAVLGGVTSGRWFIILAAAVVVALIIIAALTYPPALERPSEKILAQLAQLEKNISSLKNQLETLSKAVNMMLNVTG